MQKPVNHGSFDEEQIQSFSVLLNIALALQ